MNIISNNSPLEILSTPEKIRRKTMSYNEIQMYHQSATNSDHLTSYGAFRQQQQQQVATQMQYQGPQQLHSYQAHPYTPTRSSNTTSQHYAKGKKPSLAAFDPFSSEEASPMGRDSYSTSPDRQVTQRQPVTPPSTGRTIATATTPPSTNYNSGKFERFDNEKTPSKNPVSKTVNMILRKAALVKVRSLGQHSPNNSCHKRTSNGSNNNSNNNREKSSPVQKAGGKVIALPKIESSTKVMNKGETASPITEKVQLTPTSSDSFEKSNTSMAQDLLELKDQFGMLQIPSLMAKAAPTSFLTGNGDEGVTTNYDNDPTPFQLEIPSLSEVVTMARLNEFVENYRRHDQNLDLKQFVGLDKNELQHKIDSFTNNQNATSSGMVQEHVPIVQSLLDCCEGQEQDISIQGFVMEPGSLHDADSRVEAVIFQGQRNFTVIFRGTTEQQSKVLGNSKSKKRAVPLHSNNAAEVYSGFLESYSKVEEKCFRTIDKLVDENPFCDFVFSGYSYGAALATLAAVRYAKARPMMRVGCLTLASPKVGFSHFRHVVNTMPNLKVVRLELGGQTESKCQGPTVGGWHVGHTLVLNARSSGGSSPRSGSPTNGISSSAWTSPSVSVYKFDGAPKNKNGGFFKTSNPGLSKYISTLEELATLEDNRSKAVAASKGKRQLALPWPKDFANNAGEGVIVNKEMRLVV